MGITINVFGHVQGVGFRWHTQQIATKLDIKGFVENEPDGSVYIEASSTSNEQLQQFINAIQQGPAPESRVDNIQVKQANLPMYQDFTIKH